MAIQKILHVGWGYAKKQHGDYFSMVYVKSMVHGLPTFRKIYGSMDRRHPPPLYRQRGGRR